MLVTTVPIPQSLHLPAVPLARGPFAPFGDVVANPRPSARPSNTTPSSIAAGALPCGAVSANQGTAIQYRAIASMRDLYAQAPSGKQSTPRMTMFVCGARTLVPGGPGGHGGHGDDSVEVRVLERHPYTTQTFVPLTADRKRRYLVIVAPSLPPGRVDEGLPVPREGKEEEEGRRDGAGQGFQLPGRGLPDLSRLKAFVATGDQAVTYGAGTWHAPMVALGEPDTAIDFVVVQFANDEPVEDCQEVELENGLSDGPRIMVRVPEAPMLSKL